MSDVARIRERLEAATPGEWQPDYVEGAVYTTIDDEEYTVCATQTESGWREDTNFLNDMVFIVNAPDDIRALLSEVAQLEARVAVLEAALKPFAQRWCIENMDLEPDEEYLPVYQWADDPLPGTAVMFRGEFKRAAEAMPDA